jgi:lantibiotic modifying enzyme
MAENLITEQLKDGVDRIRHAYFNGDFKQPANISLLSGISGTALFLSIVYQIDKQEIYKEATLKLLAQTISNIENAESILATHCDGIAGWGWLLNYLKKAEIVGTEYDEYLQEVEFVLESSLSEYLENLDFDLLHGAMGLGLFFLERQRLDLVANIINALEGACIKSEREFKWKRFDKYVLKEDIYDFGLAHGNAGILYFLNKCYGQGVLPELCKEMITGLCQFFLNNIQESEIHNSYFPSSVKTADYATPQQHANNSRLAWCYGDAGILYTLLSCAYSINDEQLKEICIALLINTTERRSGIVTKVTDAGLCHGAGGLALIFLKLAKLTGKKEFHQTAEYWISSTLEMGSDVQKGAAGYLFDMGKAGWLINYDYLTGLTGVGAILLTFIDKDNCQAADWSECLFLN